MPELVGVKLAESPLPLALNPPGPVATHQLLRMVEVTLLVTRLLGQFVEVKPFTISTFPVAMIAVIDALMGEPRQFVSTLLVPGESETEGATRQFVVLMAAATLMLTLTEAGPLPLHGGVFEYC